ncbi:MAG: sensor protein [Gemmatimonadetes bacterium]|nr:sensor protein [Gemmatimonadota bacterium]
MAGNSPSVPELGDLDDRRALTRRALDQRVMAVIEGMSDAFIALGPDWRITYVNGEAARLNGVDADSLIGRNHWEQWPETVGSEVERQYQHVSRERVPVQFEHEYRYEHQVVWHDIRAYPADDGGLVVFYRDISPRRWLELERERFASELVATNARALAAMRAAQEASLAKSRFLANTSHEIRTPLNAIIGYAELLEMGLAGSLAPQQQHYIHRVQATSRHLLSLINDVLDLSKIEAGAMHAASEPGNIADIVRSSLELVEPQANERTLRVTNGCPANARRTYIGDAERVRQVLVNLLSNAIRFTEPGGRLTVTCGYAEHAMEDAIVTHDGPFVYVRVEDTGIGIADDEIAHIWDAFVQVDEKKTRKVGGSGLGLTISRHLARLMGGDVTVHSRAGVGSSFVLWLPAGVPSPAVTPEGAAQPDDAVLTSPPPARREGLRELGEALVVESERILSMYVARLRVDAGTRSARALAEPDVENHTVTMLADIAQAMSAIAHDGDPMRDSLKDGSEIQRVIAHRHGLQRARNGWSEAELLRDHAILREEVEAGLRRLVTRSGGHELEIALKVIRHFLRMADEESLRAFRGETGANPG